MALPPGVIAALGELAMSPRVQEFAGGLVQNVYGRIMPSRRSAPGKGAQPGEVDDAGVTLADLAARIEDMPVRDELITAFAVLQAELDRQHQATRRLLMVAMVAQLLTVVGVVLLLLA